MCAADQGISKRVPCHVVCFQAKPSFVVPDLGRETPAILAELLGMRILLPKWAAAPKSMLKGCNPDRTHDCWWWWLLKFLRTISAKLLQRKSHKIYVYIYIYQNPLREKGVSTSCTSQEYKMTKMFQKPRMFYPLLQSAWALPRFPVEFCGHIPWVLQSS